MARACKPPVWFAAAIMMGVLASDGQAQPAQVNTIHEVFTRLNGCWRPPPASHARDVEITVIVSFNRAGDIQGHPRISHESEVDDNDRLLYRIAVMEALQRCTPMPFTDSMGGAVAGRPFAIRFQNRKPSPKPIEKRAWLTTTIL